MTTECKATRYGGGECGPVTFLVIYASSKGEEQDRHTACFRHGLAEVERHHQSAGMSRCDLVPISG